MIKYLPILLVTFATLIGAWGALYFKLASAKLTINIFQIFKNKELIFGVLFYGVSSVFFLIGLRMGELSILYPVTSLTYVWIVFLSMKILKERMNLWKWLGIFLILSGVVIISLGV